MSVKMDWLEGTIKHRAYTEVIEELKTFFLDDFTELEFGGMGYSHSAIVCGTGRVFWSPARHEMGVHVRLPAKALALACGAIDFFTLALDMRLMGMEFTRVDFCADDTIGHLDLDVIIAAVKAGSVVMRFKKWVLIENSEGGRTLSFGSRVSDTYVRIYDKAKEQHEHGHRIRVEMELKKERANLAMVALLQLWDKSKITATVFGWLRSAIDFRVPNKSDGTKSRWVVAEWWEQFLEFCEQVRLFIPDKTRKAEDVVNWLKNQVAPSMLVAMSVLGDDGLIILASSAVNRLRPKHIAMMRGEPA
jgi:DNA relaxase NicK